MLITVNIAIIRGKKVPKANCIKKVERLEISHFEMNLFEGEKRFNDPYLLVLTERKTRVEIIEKIPDKTKNAVLVGLDRIERRRVVVNFERHLRVLQLIMEENLMITNV